MSSATEERDRESPWPRTNGGQFPWWVGVLRDFGLPTTLLFMVLWWLAYNVATPLVTSHVRFLDHQMEMMEEQSALTSKMADALASSQEFQTRVSAEHSQQLATQSRMVQILQAMCKKVGATDEVGG